MEIVAKVFIGFIALLHICIMLFEMFAWESRGPKIFSSFSKDLFSKTKAMAANQGLYNGFLAAGLIWSFFIQDAQWSQNVAIFFLSCIALAGVYGFFTVERKIIFVQTIPSLLALGLLPWA